jgi:hypothetical protein
LIDFHSDVLINFVKAMGAFCFSPVFTHDRFYDWAAINKCLSIGGLIKLLYGNVVENYT